MDHMTFSKVHPTHQISINDDVKNVETYVNDRFQVVYIYEHNGKRYNSLDELIKAGLAYKFIQIDEFRRMEVN